MEDPSVSVVIVGQLLTADGLSSRPEIAADWSTRQRSWASPASALGKVHPSRIPLDIEHDSDAEVGQVVSLFRSGSGDAWAVATSGAERLADYPEPIYFSAQFASRLEPDNLILAGVALTTASASIAKLPIEILRGQLDSRYDRSRWGLSGIRQRVVQHAVQQVRERSARRPLLVHDELPPDEVVRVRGGYLVGGEFVPVNAGDGRPEGKLRWRPSTILAVR
jgi:hypothetical protein